MTNCHVASKNLFRAQQQKLEQERELLQRYVSKYQKYRIYCILKLLEQIHTVSIIQVSEDFKDLKT